MSSSILARVADSDRRIRIMGALMSHNIQSDTELHTCTTGKSDAELTSFFRAFLGLNLLDAGALASAMIKKGTATTYSNRKFIFSPYG
jgi:hypothetical protein